MMGNALVVNLIEDMEKTLSQIFDEEQVLYYCESDLSHENLQIVKRQIEDFQYFIMQYEN